jgi:Leucine-rich repeat (LRR) protein
MPVDHNRIDTVLRGLSSEDRQTALDAVAAASKLGPAEHNALLRDWKPRKIKDVDGNPVLELTDGIWTSALIEVYFNRPGKSWEKKRIETEHLAINGSTLDGAPDPRIWRLNGVDNLPNLKTLSLLHTNHLEELDAIGKLRSLEQLWIGDMSARSLDGIAGLEALNVLDGNFARTDEALEDVSGLKGLVNLRELNLDKLPPRAQDPAIFEELSRLEVLQITGWTTLDSFDCLRGCRSLRVLDARWCEGVNSVEALSGLGRLERLLLNGVPFEDPSPLEALTSLEELHLPEGMALPGWRRR